MNTVRRLLIWVCASLLSLALFSLGGFWAFHHVFGSPKPVESALTTSGLYNNLVPNLINEEAKGSTSSDISQPVVQTAIKQAFPSSLVENDANRAINATYTWLQGTTNSLNFNINLTQATNNLANDVGNYLQARLNGLPVCTNQVALEAELANPDPYTVTCVPPDFNATTIIQQEKQSILDSDSFLKSPEITSANIKSGSGKSISSELHDGPKAYSLSVHAIYIDAVIIVLLSVALIFLYVDRHKGIRKVGFAFLYAGIISAGVALLLGYALSHLTSQLNLSIVGKQVVDSSLVTAAGVLINDFRNFWVYYGASLVVIAIVLIIIAHFIRRKARSTAATHNLNQTSDHDTPADHPKPEVSAHISASHDFLKEE